MHTGCNLKLQPHGFSWTDNWVFSGAFSKWDLFLFHNSLIMTCICTGSVVEYYNNSSNVPSGGQNGKSVQCSCAHRLLLQHRSLSGFPRDHQSADEEKPAGERTRKRKKCQTLLKACVGWINRLFFSFPGRPRLWRQHWPGGRPADRICSRVIWLHVYIWRLSKVPELCCWVLHRETGDSGPN